MAARAVAHPGFPLAALAAELGPAGTRLDALAGDDLHTDLRAVFTSSYQALTPAAARLFRLLGLHPGPDFTMPAAAGLGGLSPARTRSLLVELTRASLLAEPTPGRYSCHDLLRSYAADLAGTVDSARVRRAATARLLDHHLHTGYAASRLLDEARHPITLGPARAGSAPLRPADHQQAMDWFTAERPVLRSLVDHAAATGFEDHAGQLAWTRWPFLHRQGHWLDWVATAEVALDAARRRADATAQARAHRSLSTAYLLLGRDTDAHAQLNDALELAVASGDRLAQAHAHVRMIYFWDRQGQPEQALDHARRGLELYQALGFEAGQGACLSQIGWCQALFGEYEQAVACCAEGLTLLQRVGDLEGQAATWDTLGYAHTHLGRTDEALSCYRQAIAIYGHLGNRYDQAVSLTRLGDFRHGTGDTHAARAAWQQAMATFDELGHVDVGPVREKLRQLDKDAMARPATGASIVP